MPTEVADCTAIIVTYNSAADIAGLLDSLPAAADGLRVRVVVVDNDSTDDIAGVISHYPGVTFVPALANLGYSGGINLGRRHLGQTRAVLVLNPDLRLPPGAVRRMFEVLAQPGVGAVVPRMVDENGNHYPSLRHEPSVARALGDALLGARWPRRPVAFTEMEWRREKYRRGGPVEWATGAVVLISAEADAAIGAWDDERFFLYSEETDYFRRLREAGWTVWYEPNAVVSHHGGGSGSGPALVALLAVNRVRYFRKYHGRLASAAFRMVVALNEALRAHRPGNRHALRALLSRRRWASLPGRASRPANAPRPTNAAPSTNSEEHAP